MFAYLEEAENQNSKIVDKLPEGSIAEYEFSIGTDSRIRQFNQDEIKACDDISKKLNAMSSSGGVVLASEQPNYAPALAGVPVELSQDTLNDIESLIKGIPVFDPTGTPDVSCAWIEALSYLFADWRNVQEVYTNKIVLPKNTGEKLLERPINNDGVKKTHGKWQT